MDPAPNRQEIIRCPKTVRKLNLNTPGSPILPSKLYYLSKDQQFYFEEWLDERRSEGASLFLDSDGPTLSIYTDSPGPKTRRQKKKSNADGVLLWLVNCEVNGGFPPYERTCITVLYPQDRYLRTLYLHQQDNEKVKFVQKLNDWETLQKVEFMDVIEAAWFGREILGANSSRDPFCKDPNYFLKLVERKLRGDLLKQDRWKGRWAKWMVDYEDGEEGDSRQGNEDENA
ncbi:MAG: hypothetical protein M1820_001791 [Bogoriella megaspora]|nr:MAG: hypothetical protein M1820_001791 [Bogoriella megaspora]